MRVGRVWARSASICLLLSHARRLAASRRRWCYGAVIRDHSQSCHKLGPAEHRDLELADVPPKTSRRPPSSAAPPIASVIHSISFIIKRRKPIQVSSKCLLDGLRRQFCEGCRLSAKIGRHLEDHQLLLGYFVRKHPNETVLATLENSSCGPSWRRRGTGRSSCRSGMENATWPPLQCLKPHLEQKGEGEPARRRSPD